MSTQRLSIRMIEQMDCSTICGTTTSTAATNSMRSFDYFDDESSCQLAQSRGVRTIYNNSYHRMIQSPSQNTTTATGVVNGGRNGKYYQYQQHHMAPAVAPHLRSEAVVNSMRSMNTSFSSTGTSIAFYQSPSSETYLDRHRNDDSTEPPDRTSSIHCGRSILNPAEQQQARQRGVDRSITLPRENHFFSNSSIVSDNNNNNNNTIETMPSTSSPGSTDNNSGTWRPSTPVRKAILPNHHRTTAQQQQALSSALMVTPEVTRPTSFQRISSTSSMIPSMPPLYPSSPLQTLPASASSRNQSPSTPSRRTMRSVATLRGGHLFMDHSVNTARTTATNINELIAGNDNATMSCDDATPTTTTATTTNGIMIDMAPGVQIQLRGATETQMAINSGFYVQCECMFCSTSDLSSSSSSSSTGTAPSSNNDGSNDLYCILDCDYFICPTCRSIHPNPISSHSNLSDVTSSISNFPGGLGLGFRLKK